MKIQSVTIQINDEIQTFKRNTFYSVLFIKGIISDITRNKHTGWIYLHTSKGKVYEININCVLVIEFQ